MTGTETKKIRWWAACLVAVGALVLVLVGRDIGVADTGAVDIESDVVLGDPLDEPFSAVVRLDVTGPDGRRYGQSYVIEYLDRNDWTMVTANSFSNRDIGPQPDPDGTRTIVRDGWLRIYSEPVYDLADLDIDPASIGAPQRTPDTSGEEVVANMIADGVLGAGPRLVDELQLDPAVGAAPLGLFSMEFLRSNGRAFQHQDTIEFTADTPHGVTTYVYDRNGSPIASRTSSDDGSNRKLTVVKYEPASR